MPRKKPVKLFTLDTETIGFDGGIRRIAIYDGEEVHYGYSFEDVEHVLVQASKHNSVECYIHNLNFDLRKMPKVFEKGNVKWKTTLIINRRYVTLSCKHYKFHDSFAVLPMSLKKASEEFNLEHGKLDLWEEVQRLYPRQYTDVVDFLSNCHVDDPLYLKYLGFDVISLYELIEKLIDVSGLTLDEFVKCPTTASLSKKIFKTGYKGKQFITGESIKTDFEILCKNKYWLSDKIMKGSTISWKECEAKIREAYFGGRTEVFKPHLQADNEKIVGFHYDVNSLYPYVCMSFEYPIGVPQFITSKNMIYYKWDMWRKYKRGLGFLKCKVFVPKQHIPPLPSRKGKLVFLTGYISGTWTFPELDYAIRECNVKIEEVEEMIYFPETFKVYKNFIHELNSLKEQATKEKNLALRTFSKLILNTAYGWTATIREGKTEYDDISKADKYKDNGRFVRTDEDYGFVEAEAVMRSNSIQVQIGAYVTSYARLVLLKALKAQSEIGEVYYCDTDSIVCDKPLLPELLDNVKLGFWGLESELKEGVFLQPKVYSERTTDSTNIKFKGVSKGTQSSFDFKFYMKLFEKMKHESGKVLVEETYRLRGLVTAQKRGEDVNELIYVPKELNLDNVQKRNIDYVNNKSEAWFMSSFEMFDSLTFTTKQKWEGEFFEKRR